MAGAAGGLFFLGVAVVTTCVLSWRPSLVRWRSAPASLPDRRLPVGPTDWQTTLVAEAPDIRHPTAVVCAPDGRVFVGEDSMDMAGPADQPIDRVICVHPNGRITVFATNLFCVFGLQYLDGKLYVNHAPRFSVFTDAGEIGTDRADLFDYTNPQQLQLAARSHIPANFRLGMDGFFYMAVGDNGIYQMKSRDGKHVVLQGGGVLRFRPDGTDLEIFATGTRNHPDLAINEEDEIFTYDNSDEGEGWWTRVTHMVNGGFYGYPYDYRPRQPYTLWMMGEYGDGVPTCAMANNEDALPEEYRGNLFLGDYGRGQLMRLRVTRQGATYGIVAREKHGELDFLTKGSEQFRPIGLALSPDGLSWYITDWGTHLSLVRYAGGPAVARDLYGQEWRYAQTRVVSSCGLGTPLSCHSGRIVGRTAPPLSRCALRRAAAFGRERSSGRQTVDESAGGPLCTSLRALECYLGFGRYRRWRGRPKLHHGRAAGT